MGNPDLSLKSGFQIWQSNAKYKTDFTLTPREIFHQIMTLWVSFIPLQLEKRGQCFFFLLVMRARARQLFSQKQFISFLESSISAPPPPPPPCLKKNINSKFKKFKKRKKGKKTNDRLICVEIRFQISCRSIRISKIQVQISQSNTPSLLSSKVSGEFPWQWLLLSLYTLTNFLC